MDDKVVTSTEVKSRGEMNQTIIVCPWCKKVISKYGDGPEKVVRVSHVRCAKCRVKANA